MGFVNSPSQLPAKGNPWVVVLQAADKIEQVRVEVSDGGDDERVLIRPQPTGVYHLVIFNLLRALKNEHHGVGGGGEQGEDALEG